MLLVDRADNARLAADARADAPQAKELVGAVRGLVLEDACQADVGAQRAALADGALLDGREER